MVSIKRHVLSNALVWICSKSLLNTRKGNFGSNVWSIKIRTIHKLSLRLYYQFFWQILSSYCKFLMPRPFKWSILGIHKIILSKIFIKSQRQIMCGSNFYGSDVICTLQILDFFRMLVCTLMLPYFEDYCYLQFIDGVRVVYI